MIWQTLHLPIAHLVNRITIDARTTIKFGGWNRITTIPYSRKND